MKTLSQLILDAAEAGHDVEIIVRENYRKGPGTITVPDGWRERLEAYPTPVKIVEET